MNRKLILDALRCYAAECKSVGANLTLLAVEDEIRKMQEPVNGMKMRGGRHLGIMREWMQRHCVGGENYTWGSRDQVRFGGKTVFDMEVLAQRIAAAAVEDYKNGITDWEN